MNNVSNFTDETKMYTVTFYAGQTTASLDVQIIDDNLIENDEVLQFLILRDLLPDGVGSSNPNKATLIVIDDPGNHNLFSYGVQYIDTQ